MRSCLNNCASQKARQKRLQIITIPFLGWGGLRETSLSESPFSELWRLLLFLPRLASGLTWACDYEFTFFFFKFHFLFRVFMKVHLRYIWGQQTAGKWPVHMERHIWILSFLSLHQSTGAAENSWVCSRAVDQVFPSHSTRDGTGQNPGPARTLPLCTPGLMG